MAKNLLESAGEARWLQGKARMLDEVDKLVELMSAEKSKLQERILSLESEVDDYHKQTKQLQQSSEKKDENLIKLKLEQTIAREKTSQQQSLLQSTLHRTMRELKRVQDEMEALTHSLENETLIHREDKLKLEVVEQSNADLSKQLHHQMKQTKKLKELMGRAEEKVKEVESQRDVVEVERKLLEAQVEKIRAKEKKSREEILALRGRLSRSQRAQDQVVTHCSVLEKEVESQVKQLSTFRSQRSKEEMRLIQECRKKDELLATYVHKVSTAQEEQQVLLKELKELKMRLSAEENQRKELNLEIEAGGKRVAVLESLTEESTRLQQQQDERSTMEQSLLLEKMIALTETLDSAQKELSREKTEVHSLREKEKYFADQLKTKEEEVSTLRGQLETAWSDHQESVALLERQWVARLTESRSEYVRLKDVSTRRCVELAREISQLKSDPNKTV